jgi:hypothetical protein
VATSELEATRTGRLVTVILVAGALACSLLAGFVFHHDQSRILYGCTAVLFAGALVLQLRTLLGFMNK